MKENDFDSAQPRHYDVIVIGSGLGSLAAASLLAQFENKKVLVVEKHFKIGGYTHTFKRKQKYHFDVGVHYIGDMYKGAPLRQMMDVVSDNKVDWVKLPDPFEVYQYPDYKISQPDSVETYKGRLAELFPEEKEAILKFFRDVNKYTNLLGLLDISAELPGSLKYLGKLSSELDRSEAFASTKEYLDKNFKSEKLKGILYSQWGSHALPPSTCPFAMHAVVVNHFQHGGYYPAGGSGKIAENVIPIIEAAGGAALTSHEVTEIIIENSKAVGVRVCDPRTSKTREKTKTFTADKIISGAGAFTTYTKLIPESFPISFRGAMMKFLKENPVASLVVLNGGFKGDPRDLGFHGENHWIFNGYDHDKFWNERNKWIENNTPPQSLYMSFPSLKDPEVKSGHTVDIMHFVDFKPFEKWLGSEWKKRGDDYEAFKSQLGQRILETVETKYPGFTAALDFWEVSTPLTNISFTNHFEGGIYGMPMVKDRFSKEKAPWCLPQTPVENLYLTGIDVAGPGVAGAMMGGIIASGYVMEQAAFKRFLRKLITRTKERRPAQQPEVL